MRKRKQQAPDVSEIEAAIKTIEDNSHNLKHVDKYRWHDLITVFNSMGISLVKTDNLADLYKVQEFCNGNDLEFINYYF